MSHTPLTPTQAYREADQVLMSIDEDTPTDIAQARATMALALAQMAMAGAVAAAAVDSAQPPSVRPGLWVEEWKNIL